MPEDNPIDQAGGAALRAVREHGLCGRADSPPEWDKALGGARAGDPILVKDPDDPRDDYFLVPLIPSIPASKRAAWVTLDTKTLALREASLLENWKTPAFPDENSGDADRASQQSHTLPDGTVARFNKEDLTPNKNNLVWKASAASILPYWPLKELTAAHPATGEPVSIYVTQDGRVYSQLLPDDAGPPPPRVPQTDKPPRAVKPKSRVLRAVVTGLGLGAAAAGCYFYFNRPTTSQPSDPSSKRAPSHNGRVYRYSLAADNDFALYTADGGSNRRTNVCAKVQQTTRWDRPTSGTFTTDSEYIFVIVMNHESVGSFSGYINGIDISTVRWEISPDISSSLKGYQTATPAFQPEAQNAIAIFQNLRTSRRAKLTTDRLGIGVQGVRRGIDIPDGKKAFVLSTRTEYFHDKNPAKKPAKP